MNKRIDKRTCEICSSTKTYVSKQGYEKWGKTLTGFLCCKCACKRFDGTPKRKKIQKKFNEKRKILALNLCGGLECINCGQTDIRTLELNFIGGGHTKLAKSNKIFETRSIYYNLIKGKIDPKLFDVRCKVCNMVEYVERVFGLKYKIIVQKY